MLKRNNVPLTTLYYRDLRRPLKETSEEKALKKHLKLMSNLRNPMQIKFIGSLAFSIAYQRSTTDKAIKPLGKN